jgi:hypothetical protein
MESDTRNIGLGMLAGGSDFILKNLANTAYLNDILLPAGMYFLARASFIQNKYLCAAAVFASCSAFEIAQKVGMYPGTYDPKDFVAYAAGAGIGLITDKILDRHYKKRKLEMIGQTK